MIYRFEIVRSGPYADSFKRDLPDDLAAVEWMGNESLASGDRLEAFRDGSGKPFARREFGTDVEVFG